MEKWLELDCLSYLMKFKIMNKNYMLIDKKLENIKDKEKISKQQKQKYERTKDKILERQGKNYICECGSNYTHGHKNRHFQSKKHCQFLESKTT
jgi:hypothetical protein